MASALNGGGNGGGGGGGLMKKVSLLRFQYYCVLGPVAGAVIVATLRYMPAAAGSGADLSATSVVATAATPAASEHGKRRGCFRRRRWRRRSKPAEVLVFNFGDSNSDTGGAVAIMGIRIAPPRLLRTPHRALFVLDFISALGIVAGLTGLRLSRTEVAPIASLGRTILRCRSNVSMLPYYLSLFGSHFVNLLGFLKQNPSHLRCSLEKVVKPNVAFLRECGLGGGSSFPKMCLSRPWILGTKPERVRAMVACAKGLGVPCGYRMFRHVLHAVSPVGEENITAKLEYLKKKTFWWSDDEVGIVVCKTPAVLPRSKDTLQRFSEFLIS